jgi:hypothetical protein
MAFLPPLDMLATPTRSPDPGAPEAARVALQIPINGVRLVDFAETPRFRIMDQMEAYFRRSQHRGKMYDWDGRFMGYGDESPIKPGYVVPYAQRRPAARYDLAVVIVRRLTSMLFGTDRFPEISVVGDEEAEDYLRALMLASRLPMRMVEARDLGGATGTACLSFAFVGGCPRVEVHNAKHCTVLQWADESERRPSQVLKTYAYQRQVWDPQAKKLRDVTFYYARLWTEMEEVVWQPIPKSLAQQPNWASAPSTRVRHDFGFCPFYWIQNIADSAEPDGEGDYEGLEDKFNEIDQLLSAASKGTKANIDPTLVIKMDPAHNTGSVKKGSENAIFSTGGAEYLEMKGQSTKAAIEMLERLRLYTLDAASVVLADPDKLSGAAQSAQALRILYAPMLARCDLYREQYGEFGIRLIARDMLRAARLILSRPAATAADGTEVRDAILLPPRMVDGKLVERTPGMGETVELNWNPYFAPTWEDISKAVTATQAAAGGKPIISQRTAVAATQQMFNVHDVEAEMEAIEDDADRAVEAAMRTMGGDGPLVPTNGKPTTGKPPAAEAEDEEE